jgi:hypothetical protein
MSASRMQIMLPFSLENIIIRNFVCTFHVDQAFFIVDRLTLSSEVLRAILVLAQRLLPLLLLLIQQPMRHTISFRHNIRDRGLLLC